MKARLWLCVALAAMLAACGGAPAAQAPGSPSPTPLTSSPSPSPSPSQPIISAGAPAWVAVSVASGWRSPDSPRAVDSPALENPAQVQAWLGRMSAADRVGLIDRLDTQALLGDEVMVLEIRGDWARVAIPDQATPLDSRGYPVWIPLRQLTAIPPPGSDELVTVTAPRAYLHSAVASLEVSFGTTLPMLRQEGDTFLVGLPGGSSMLAQSGDVMALRVPATGTSIVSAVRRFKGLPYLWGGTSGFGFDCSGLVHLVYKASGVALPRDSDPQSRTGVAVSRSELQAGDLVFFSSRGVAYHVAIYAGSGMVIDSPSPGYAVEEVSLAAMPNASDYSGASRVLPTSTTPPA